MLRPSGKESQFPICSCAPGPEANIEGRELRRIYIIESSSLDERLVVFEDGELLRTVEDPDFHAYTWDE